jgi:hypothetical protein
MRILGLRAGDGARVELDANQISTSPITLYEGPVESQLMERLGLLYPPTRLYGRVWTGGPVVVVRYYEAHPPDRDKIPICAVARPGNGQLKKQPESKPGMAVVDDSEATLFIVDSFR